jgi:chemotaxis protein methyltransferase CheR
MPEIVLKDSDFQKFSHYVYDMSGINLHGGKKELVKARLGKIFRERNFRSLKDYYNHVINDKSGHELVRLLDSISTNLTYFFREPQHFEFLSKSVLPEIINEKECSRDNCLRFWSAGCSSGEEAYSIAIAVNEALGSSVKWQTKIVATDLSTKVLAIGKTGIYEQDKVKNIPYDLKSKYFQKGENRYKGYFRVKEATRNKISFQRVNFIENFHFAEPFDVIFCRNVMIYFDNPTKEFLIDRIYVNTVKGGYLFVGHAESLTCIKHGFKYIKPSIYKKA